MTGVEILATQEVVSEYAYNLDCFWAVFGMVFCILFVIGIVVTIGNRKLSDLFAWAFLGALYGLMLGLLFGALTQTPLTYVTEYKVTVSEEVLMTEFYERYEVVGQEGKIFTVRERQ